MLIFRLALRALRWRAAATATVFVVALIGILAATVGPIYLASVNAAVLGERLQEARQNDRDLRVSRDVLAGVTNVDWPSQLHFLAGEAADKRWFDPPVFSEEGPVTYRRAATGSRSHQFASRLAALDHLCTHLRFVSGRCVGQTAADEAVVSVGTAKQEHLGVGAVMRPIPLTGDTAIRLRVVGIYQPIAPRGPFWAPWDYFDAEGNTFDNQLPKLDTFFVSHVAMSSRTRSFPQTLQANVHLRPERVSVGEVSALRNFVHHIDEVAATGQHTPGLAPPTVATRLDTVLDGMRHEMSLARTLIILPTVQLALLAIFVLYAVVAGTSSIQGPEVALAKLRGRRPRSVLLQGVLQPIVVLVLATPVAAFLAWLTVVLVRGHLLGRPVDVTFPTSAVEVAALAAAGGILATIVAARKIVVSPVAALLRRGGDSSGSSLGLALADAAAVTLALAGLVQLIAGGVLDSGHADPLSALAPTLIAVAAAVIVLRLLPYLGRAAVTSTRDSRRLAAFLAVRQIVRRPAGARVLLLVAVSIALATFAVTNWSVARSNREARALNQAGASTVLEVTPAAGIHDLRAAVDQADPSGQSMAAAVVRGPATSMLAVDTKRFADVAAWSSDYSPLSLHDTLAALTPTRPPAVSFTGDDLRFTVTMTRSPPRPVTLSVGVTGVDHFKHNYDVAVVHHGTGTYTQDVRPSCATTCRITSFALTPKQDLLADATHGSNVPRVVATVAAAAGHGPLWQPVTGFSEPRRWRDDGQAIANVRAGSGSLRLELEQSSPGGPWATILAEDVPAHLPAILASGTFGAYPGDSVHDVSVEGLDTGTQPIDGVAESVTLPELDRFGVMVDLGLAQQAMAAGPGFQTDYQIWLSPSAPKDLAARLARLGITVTKTIKSATYRAALDHTGPAFADGLFLVAAVAATLLAIGATVLGGVIAARRRAYELAALEAVGVAPRTLRRATAIEQGILLAAGLFVGLAAGIGGSMLALPTTPFFVDETIGPPTQHDLPIGLLAALVAGLAAVFLLTCFGVARLVLRQATAGRLREAQQ